ncbi:hypothetical protein [Sinomonas flava]|uniref:Uncharacterized protein n=1 Tax=Sinomonas flava TaxID=496857 RepID=A0ABP5NIF4_9MICC
MSLIESSNNHTRRLRRRGGRMHLGEDILLARHGSNISSLRLDRRANRMVATLHDGSIDCASNSLLPVHPSPLARIGQQIEAVREDKASVSRAEIRTLVKFSAIWLAISVLFTAGVIALALTTGSSEALNSAAFYPAY